MVKKQKIPTLRYTTLCWSACLVITKSFVTRQVCWFMPHIKGITKRKPVVGRRNAENAGKRSSSADEMRKTMKSALRRPTKCRNRRKMPVVGRRNAGFTENHSSSMDENEKEAKNARYPWMKVEKW